MPKSLSIGLIYVCLLFSMDGVAQSRTIDSLQHLLSNSKDTFRVNLLNQLSSAYWYSDPQKTILYASEALDLAKKLNFKKGITKGYNNTGVAYYQQNKYQEALLWYNKALAMHKETGNYTGEGYVLSNMGLIYWKQGDLHTAVQYYLKALKIWDDHHVEEEKASIFDNLGNVYNDQEDYDRAISYYLKAIEIQKKYPGDAVGRSMTLGNIGTAYLAKKDYTQALKFFFESLPLLSDEQKEVRAVSLSNIGLAYAGLKENTEAFQYLSEAQQLQQEMKDDDGIVYTLLGLATTSQQTGDLEKGTIYAEQALTMAQKINNKRVLENIWLLLSDISQQQRDYKKAYSYYVNYVKARDSISNKENIYKIAQLQAGIETEKKQAEIELLKKEHEQEAFRRNTIGAGLIALLVIAALIVNGQRVRIRKNNQLQKINTQLISQSARLEDQAKKLRELDQVKSTFFANVSHEFRTPLTLILNSLADRITAVNAAEDKRELEQLEVMYRNAKRLLNLINQLLDLSKFEAGEMKLSTENCDLKQLLGVVYGSFTSLSTSRQIKFSFTAPQETILCRLDVDKTEKILYNLLSNAFKFTPVGGAIDLDVKLNGDIIKIIVQDSGRGIAEEQLAHVFNRFYQGKQYYSDEQGTGIGLALTKELVELHGGRIWAESQQIGACFTVELPLVPAIKEDQLFQTSTGNSIGANILSIAPAVGNEQKLVPVKAHDDQGRCSILIVEDNVDLRNYIRRHLEESYDVIESENGKRGLELAIATIPDLVISDWMMPEMDGLTLCHRLKTDERTSHIPVIILTALAGNDTKIQSLETGADEYLTKPFDNRELHVRIKNLVENRQRLRERFSRELHLGPKKLQVSSMDEKFLEKVMTAIETYMGDPEFSMEKFGQEVSLSRMQLHRKLKALTGESPGDFLRTMRLMRARRLLESRSGNVSEIAYEVGFNNLSYFSKCYREQFGIAPHETIPAKVTDFS